ncbi:hypothetical protein PPERSA_08378 [Pseudocohnilembus persalinus]|uniref:Uncharacterized protein n=1 Tax=Pseudocohnilembus persalinus TaxID=266149 RepID=A0A0V0R675_PSEPJ|nr:hypothetical protein PPERSA_08378 [Pseudocohnilembus persalinus]|eukprot:KRX09977.1 hypothetical protein PPERSA_08378 [Pseudocohnilembus persalinus]
MDQFQSCSRSKIYSELQVEGNNQSCIKNIVQNNKSQVQIEDERLQCMLNIQQQNIQIVKQAMKKHKQDNNQNGEDQTKLTQIIINLKNDPRKNGPNEIMILDFDWQTDSTIQKKLQDVIDGRKILNINEKEQLEQEIVEFLKLNKQIAQNKEIQEQYQQQNLQQTNQLIPQNLQSQQIQQQENNRQESSLQTINQQQQNDQQQQELQQQEIQNRDTELQKTNKKISHQFE